MTLATERRQSAADTSPALRCQNPESTSEIRGAHFRNETDFSWAQVVKL